MSYTNSLKMIERYDMSNKNKKNKHLKNIRNKKNGTIREEIENNNFIDFCMKQMTCNNCRKAYRCFPEIMKVRKYAK